jgi:two-component system nitrate/nitrite response regulator NarL
VSPGLPLESAKVRLLLVDDHGLFREGLSRLLADESGLELVAQCSSVASVEEVCRAIHAPWQPSRIDLMLLDFDLGEQTGFDALEAARSLGFAGRVLLVTAGMGPAETLRAFDEGVSGIFLKHSPPSELLQAIRQVVAGAPWPDRGSVDRLLAVARAAEAPRQGRLAQPLTPRERAVLRGVFEGRANKEIAAELQVSEGSVKSVLQQLFAKTGVRSRAQLVRIALENRYEYQLELG